MLQYGNMKMKNEPGENEALRMGNHKLAMNSGVGTIFLIP